MDLRRYLGCPGSSVHGKLCLGPPIWCSTPLGFPTWENGQSLYGYMWEFAVCWKQPSSPSRFFHLKHNKTSLFLDSKTQVFCLNGSFMPLLSIKYYMAINIMCIWNPNHHRQNYCLTWSTIKVFKYDFKILLFRKSCKFFIKL